MTARKSLGTANMGWRAGVALAGTFTLCSALLGLVPPGPPSLTGASWLDEDYAVATISAATVPPATLTAECRYRPGLLGLGARVEIYWNLPVGYELEDAELWASQSGLGSALAPLTGFSLAGNTQYDSRAGHLITTVPTNLLGGLLGLGTEIELSIVIHHQSGHEGWSSEPVSVATNAGLIAGIGGTCRNLD